MGLACLPSPPRRMCRPGTPVHRISPLSEQIGHAMGRRLGVEGLDMIRPNDGLACTVGDLVLNVREALAFHRVPDRAGHGCVL